MQGRKASQVFRDLRKQIEKVKKRKDKNAKTSQPGAKPNGLIELSDRMLVGLALPTGDARP